MGPDITHLSDDFPILLGPVRVETRFAGDELLVRVFPDEWQIEAHEEKPTDSDIAAVDHYWTARWRAGGDPTARELAWQELVRRVGAGRAGWLVRVRLPANPADEPAGTPPGHTVLVVVSAQPVPANDRAPTVAYWTAIWRARGDAATIRTANRALVDAVGGTRAATIRARRPAGIDTPAAGAGDDVTVAFLVLPPPAAGTVATDSWTRAARARLLPDRFVVLGYAGGEQVLQATGAPVRDPLVVSPDPAAADQLRVDPDGALHVPDDLRWMTDFARAVEVGTGLRIPLDDNAAGGLDRLLVLGLRAAASPEQAGTDLAALISRQLRSPAGFSLVPQGTPTNNTEAAPAGPPAEPEAEAAAGARAAAHTGTAVNAAGGDWTAKTDGQWLAELLGIDPAVMAGAPYADGTDQRDSRAANTALWPATWGYHLATMLHPVLPAAAIAATREFFTRYVSGRGPVPAVRIGRQPYGILPTTAFSRLAWPDGSGHRRQLHKVLTTVAADWAKLAADVSHVGAGGDRHQVLLDVLALHPASVEFHQRFAHSVAALYNRENFFQLGPRVLPVLAELGMPQPIRQLLDRLAGAGTPDPELIRRVFASEQYPLLGPLVDDRPPSETEPVRGYAEDGRNYLRWLADAARADLEAVRLQAGLAEPPTALLYLLLRHAVLLGWEEAARRLAAPAEAPVEPLFVHVDVETEPSESRYRRLYSPDQAVTGDPQRPLVDFIPDVIGSAPATSDLAEQIAAVEALRDVPTAKLERVLVEHLDCATYRLDAWRLGLATERLAELRYGADGTGTPRRGLHIGAYAWLEDLAPRGQQPTPVTLPTGLAEIFDPDGTSPPVHDPANGGHLLAPSPNHATTAAVLRAGYLANAAPDNPGTFAVNLSAERVRIALSFLEGLREGQSLGALLGYQLERGLHDRYQQAEVDSFIAILRLAFPLRAGRVPGTEPTPGTVEHIEQVEARNVVDGLELVRHVTRTGAHTYPFGLTRLPGDATEAQRHALESEVERLLDINDALADLALAESTHQAMLGNPERAAATLDAYAKAGLPPQPSVVETPRSGITLTHRLGLQFRSGLPPGHGVGLFGGSGPRAKAEPAVNDWLAGVLPKPSDVVCVVAWTDPVDGDQETRVVTQHDVGLQPIDLLWTVRPEHQIAMGDLDDRVIGHVVERDRPRPDATLQIRYTGRIGDKVSFFELSSLVSPLRTLLTTSRPLRASDLAHPAGADPVDRELDAAVGLPKTRATAVRADLVDLREELEEYLEDLTPLLADEHRDDLLDDVDAFGRRLSRLLVTANGFGLVRSGWGEFVAWRRGVYADLLAAVAATAQRLAESLAAADALIAEFDALPNSATTEERFRLLERAERLLTTTPTSPRPSTVTKLRANVLDRRGALSRKADRLRDFTKTREDTLSGLLDDVRHQLPLTEFDRTGLDLTPFEDRIVAFCGDLARRAGTLVDDIAARLTAAGPPLTAYDEATTGPEQVAAAKAALRALLGEDVLAIEEFTPVESLADQWRDAVDDSEDGDLTEHLDRDFPVDDWLHGLARVRQKPRLWERATLLSAALRTRGLLGGLLGNDDEPQLLPIQLPYRANDRWLGLEFPDGHTPSGDRVLYTAHYAERFNANRAQCGLLLDEWTEVLPAADETASLAFHYDSPGTEPPQAMLLVVPPARTGSWRWDDVVAALHETLDLAKVRAVEPGHTDDSAYAHLLPATLMAGNRQPITISTDLAVNNLGRPPTPGDETP